MGTPVTPHPYNGLNYGHSLYGIDSIGSSDPIVVTDDAVCPTTAQSNVLDELFCSMKRFFGRLFTRRVLA